MTDVKITNSLSVLKIAFIVPALVCSVFLMSFGYQVTLYDEEISVTTITTSDYEMLTSNDTIMNLNSTITKNTTTTNHKSFNLLNDIWVSFHGLLAMIFILYMFLTAMMLFANLKTS